MTILFLGDIVGKPGRDLVLRELPGLRSDLAPDLVVANAENVAAGRGITPALARSLLDGGVDVLTLGNHTWARTSDPEFFDGEPRLLRPVNYPPGAPGRGVGVFRTGSGHLVGVVNLLGRSLMEPVDDPFRAVDAAIAQLSGHTPILLLDFHAETTSEKAAMGWHVDGRLSAVVGTHTHVPTADERILPGGTAFLSDVGMCGPVDSILGMATEGVLAKFRTGMPQRFEVAEGPSAVCGVRIEIDDATGKASRIERVRREE